MTAAELYEMLKKIQEPKGYFFNKDRDLVDQLWKVFWPPRSAKVT